MLHKLVTSVLKLFIIVCFIVSYYQDPDFDNMSSFFPCEIDDAIQLLGFQDKQPRPSNKRNFETQQLK